MPRYRYVFLNRRDRVFAYEEMEYADSDAALKYAQEAFGRDHQSKIEVWEGASKLFTVAAPRGAGRPRP